MTTPVAPASVTAPVGGDGAAAPVAPAGVTTPVAPAGVDAPVGGDGATAPVAPAGVNAPIAGDRAPCVADTPPRMETPALVGGPSLVDASSLADRVARAGACFARAGVAADEAAADAEVLARHVLGWDRATYLARRRDPAPQGFEARYAPLADRRARREPVSLLTGRREFWGLAFAVGPAVLTPRPETELIVETALALFGDRRAAPLAIADVGTGSGCLAVTLAREFPRAAVTGVDISADALAVARRNAAAHGVADRIAWVETSLADWLSGSAGADTNRTNEAGTAAGMDGGTEAAPDGEGAGSEGDGAPAGAAPDGGDAEIDPPAADLSRDPRVPSDLWPCGRRIDLLVANLPYVPTGELVTLPPEVRRHEPRVALDGGPDGLGPLRELLRGAPPRLNAGARVLVEMGMGQADALGELVAAVGGLELLDIRPDLQGIPRTAVIAAGGPGSVRESAAQQPHGRR